MIPQALEFVASHFGHEKLYHLVAHWNMPKLFLQCDANNRGNAST